MYEVVDTKLARSAKPAHVLQLCFYSEQLGRIQGRLPEFFHVELGTGVRETFRTADLWDDHPPEAWETAQRLVALGYERHAVQHMLCSVVAREVWSVLDSGLESDPACYVAALDELPESYFALAEEP